MEKIHVCSSLIFEERFAFLYEVYEEISAKTGKVRNTRFEFGGEVICSASLSCMSHWTF